MDLARCETHDETFPLGQVCRFHGREHEAWLVYAEEADQQRVRAVAAEAALEHTRIDRDETRDEADRLRTANAAAMRIEFDTIRALIDALGLDPTTAEGCVPGRGEIEPTDEHYVWHLTQDRRTLAQLRDRADQEIADAQRGEWFADETDDADMLAREQQRRGIWATVRAMAEGPGDSADPAKTQVSWATHR